AVRPLAVAQSRSLSPDIYIKLLREQRQSFGHIRDSTASGERFAPAISPLSPPGATGVLLPQDTGTASRRLSDDRYSASSALFPRASPQGWLPGRREPW